MGYRFNTKVIISGSHVEYIDYEKPIFVGYPKQPKKKVDGIINAEPKLVNLPEEQNKKEQNKKRSIRRTKVELIRKINSNEHLTKFLTLTFDPKKFPDTTEIKVANKLFNKFIMRLTYKYEKLMYISVPEFQQDIDHYGNKKPNGGNLHYHLLCNLKYIPILKLQKIWNMGGIDIRRIDKLNNVGIYIGKYLEKNLEDKRFKNKKKYFASENLNKPIVLTDIQAHGYMIRNKEKLQLVHEVKYSNDYTGEINHRFYQSNLIVDLRNKH